MTFILGYFAYMGIFNRVTVITGHEGGYQLAGLYHQGSYGQIGETFEAVIQIADSLELEDYDMASIYFNRPDQVPEDSLLTFVGVVLSSQGEDIGNMDLGRLLPESIPNGEAVYADFVYRNFFSYSIGAIKCFPELMKETEAKGWTDLIGFEYYNSGESTRYVLLRGNLIGNR